ncbi:MAG: RES family NAD+ phosphorylase [Gammaproteobacteria bacterium]|nr:RES family NAD+ phosphorylase [Gammaproteobacteria bacterium]
MSQAVSISWNPSWRIIPSRFLPIQLFERVTDSRDLEAVFALDALTNPGLYEEVGDLNLVLPQDRVNGPETSVIMAPFTHPNPSGSRFSNGLFGVLYCAGSLETAIAETCYHRERFMLSTNQPGIELDMRVCCIDLFGELHDLRGKKEELPLIYDENDYTAAQVYGTNLRKAGSNGSVYDSIRKIGGECAAVFRPSLLSNVRQERHLCYVWDGQKIATVYEKQKFLSG